MKFYGYKKDGDELLELEEVTLQCSVNELEDIIGFLIETKKKHSSVMDKTDICHSHFKDWSESYNKSNPDFIIVSKFK